VENAIKYGMKSSPLPLKIRISASRRGDGIRIVVANSGSWYVHNEDDDLKSSTGTGLSNVRLRLENAYPGEHTLEVRSNEDGVHVVIDIHRISEEGGS